MIVCSAREIARHIGPRMPHGYDQFLIDEGDAPLLYTGAVSPVHDVYTGADDFLGPQLRRFQTRDVSIRGLAMDFYKSDE